MLGRAATRIRRFTDSRHGFGGFRLDDHWAGTITDKVANIEAELNKLGTVDGELKQLHKKQSETMALCVGAICVAGFVWMVPQTVNHDVIVQGGGGGGGASPGYIDQRQLNEFREEMESTLRRTIDKKIEEAFDSDLGKAVAKHTAALYEKGVAEAEKKLDVARKVAVAEADAAKQKAQFERPFDRGEIRGQAKFRRARSRLRRQF